MKYLSLFAFLFISQLSVAQQSATIKGEVQNLGNYSLAFVYHSPEKKKLDTVQVVNNHFEHKIEISDMQEIAVYPYRFYENGIPTLVPGKTFLAPMLILFVSDGDVITIKGDAMRLWEAKVTGGKYDSDFARLRNLTLPLITERHHLLAEQYSEKNKKDSVAFNTWRAERSDVVKLTKQVVSSFYKTNLNSAYALYKFSEDLRNMSPTEVGSLLASYSPELQKTNIAEQIRTYLNKVKKIDVGSKMTDFTGTTLTGISFDSKNLRGKYVLLDFWGSWCGPCRKSNPHLKELYAAYKDKGFEIVGVGDEMTSNVEAAKKRLAKAVKEDGIPWVQILNNGRVGKNANLVEAYNVKGFPTKYLIDKNGVIIWKGSGMDSPELDKKLAEIF